jgi:hypothetical protein
VSATLDVGTSYDTTQTSSGGATIGTIKWADYSVLLSSPQELILVNTKRPRTMPETFKTGSKPIKDVYAGSSINAANRALDRSGTVFVVQNKQTFLRTEAGLADVYLPVQCTITVSVPNDALVTATVTKNAILRALQGLFNSGTDSNARIDAILHGAYQPVSA